MTCMNLLLDINVAYNRHILVGLQCVIVCLIILALQCIRPIHFLLIYMYVCHYLMLHMLFIHSSNVNVNVNLQ